jgi:glycosyltransferase involved in cell wall biosynthesis
MRIRRRIILTDNASEVNVPFYSGNAEEKKETDVRQRPVAILYFGTYEESYSRNQIMMKSLKRMGHRVKECHVSLWGNKTDKTRIFRTGYDTVILLLGLVTAYPRLFIKYLSIGHYDIVFIGYPGHLDVLVVKFLEFITRRKKRIVFDAFISLYDTIAGDRGMVRERSIIGRCIFLLDRIACSFADVILLDTHTHIRFFQETFSIPEKKMVRVYASADTDIFYPRETAGTPGGFQVLFTGKYTPLHGIEHIVDAAELLKDQSDLQFVFIGRGQLYGQIRALVDRKDLKNIRFIEWVDYETLPDYIKKADVCLGVFSKTAKANRVIPNKIFQAMAMGKPVISGKTSGILECLTHRENIFLCEPGDPVALSGAILALKSDEDLRIRIGSGALKTFEEDLGDKAMIMGLTNVFDALRHEKTYDSCK